MAIRINTIIFVEEGFTSNQKQKLNKDLEQLAPFAFFRTVHQLKHCKITRIFVPLQHHIRGEYFFWYITTGRLIHTLITVVESSSVGLADGINAQF